MKNYRWFCSFSTVLCPLAILLVSGCKTSPPTAVVDTAPTVAISSAANRIVRMTDTVYVNADDDRWVTYVELYAENQLVAADYEPPWIFAWNTEDWTDGTCDLVAVAYDAGKHSTISSTVTVTIHNAFPVTFINPTYTTISVTVSGVQLSVLAGDSTTYTLPRNPRSLGYTATTSGKAANGTRIGLLLSLQETGVDVSNSTSCRVRMNIPSNYFFMYLINTGKSALSPIYVNYGLTDETRDDISIPNDGLKRPTGYYKAYANTQVRGYWNSPYSGYSYWNQGTNFTFPWVENQAVTLWNSSPSVKGGTVSYVQSQEPPITGVLMQVPAVAGSNIHRVPDDGAVPVFLHD